MVDSERKPVLTADMGGTWFRLRNYLYLTADMMIGGDEVVRYLSSGGTDCRCGFGRLF